MSNVLQFPAMRSRNQVQVKCLREPITGKPVYRFDDVNLGGYVLFTLVDPTEVAKTVEYMLSQRVIVDLDDETRTAIYGDGGTAA